MKSFIPRQLLAAALMAAGVCAGGEETVPVPPPNGGDWQFGLKSYAWLPALDGELGIGPIAAEHGFIVALTWRF